MLEVNYCIRILKGPDLRIVKIGYLITYEKIVSSEILITFCIHVTSLLKGCLETAFLNTQDVIGIQLKILHTFSLLYTRAYLVVFNYLGEINDAYALESSNYHFFLFKQFGRFLISIASRII